MADSKQLFEEFVAPLFRYVCETPNRVPLADIYFADTGRRRANQARSVVGGFFMKLLADQLARSRLVSRPRPPINLPWRDWLPVLGRGQPGLLMELLSPRRRP